MKQADTKESLLREMPIFLTHFLVHIFFWQVLVHILLLVYFYFL